MFYVLINLIYHYIVEVHAVSLYDDTNGDSITKTINANTTNLNYTDYYQSINSSSINATND